jgi:hypothetical protein
MSKGLCCTVYAASHPCLTLFLASHYYICLIISLPKNCILVFSVVIAFLSFIRSSCQLNHSGHDYIIQLEFLMVRFKALAQDTIDEGGIGVSASDVLMKMCYDKLNSLHMKGYCVAY